MIFINILVLCNVDLDQKWGDYTRVFSLMGEFQKLGHRVFIMIIRPESKTPRISSFKENNLDVIEIHPPRILPKGEKGIFKHLRYLACIPSISKIASKIIKENKIDFVYSYMPGTGTSIPAIRIKSKHKIKFVLDLADMYSMIRPKMVVEQTFKNADKILVITEYLKNDLLKRKIPLKKIHINPNGVDLDLFNPKNYNQKEIQNLRKSFNADKLIVFSGSLQDLNIIIESAQQVISKIKNVKYLIIGDHRIHELSKKMWENKVKEKGLSNYFQFLGRKPREEIPKYLLCADVCVDSFPDEPYFAAAHPIKLLEYGACEKPVVATRVQETAKIVKHGKYGFLADPKNATEYSEYLIKLLNSETLCNEMGMDFAQFIRENFNWKKLALDLQNFLQN